MATKQKISIFWFRRDLRLHDNTGLGQALQGPYPVLPLFIFDINILNRLENKQDARLSFIYEEVRSLHEQLKQKGFSLLISHGNPLAVFRELAQQYSLAGQHCAFYDFKDQVIFDRNEILNGSGEPYKVFTPYCKKWLEKAPDLSATPASNSLIGAQPYFRIFNPLSQARTYDPEGSYIRRWVPEWGTTAYPEPIVDMKASRAEAIATYKKHLNG